MSALININTPAKFIIDGHWYVRSRHAVVLKNNPECTFTENYERDKKTFWTKLTMDLMSDLRSVGNFVNDITIVSDYKSWRKDHKYIVAPWQSIEQQVDSYKSNRTYSTEINWLQLYKAFDEWCLMLEQHFKIAYIKAYGAEGDDLMHVIKGIYNNAGQNVILYTTDGDSIQNCVVNENGSYTVQFKKQRGNKFNNFQTINTLICTDAFNDALKESVKIDMFSYEPGQQSAKESMQDFFKAVDTHNIPAFIFCKCIFGDGGDNVKPVMQKFTAKTAPVPKLKHLTAALEAINMTYDKLTFEHLYNVDFLNSVLAALHNNFMGMLTLPDNYKKYYLDKFIENRHLMYLNKFEMPKTVMTTIANQIAAKTSIFATNSNIFSMPSYIDVLRILGIDAERQYQSNDPFSTLIV